MTATARPRSFAVGARVADYGIKVTNRTGADHPDLHARFLFGSSPRVRRIGYQAPRDRAWTDVPLEPGPSGRFVVPIPLRGMLPAVDGFEETYRVRVWFDPLPKGAVVRATTELYAGDRRIQQDTHETQHVGG